MRNASFLPQILIIKEQSEAMRGIASIYLLCGQSKFDMRFALDMHTLRCVDMPCKQGVIFARPTGKLAILLPVHIRLILRGKLGSDIRCADYVK